MSNVISIKLPTEALNPNALMIVKEATGLGLSEIKSRAQNNEDIIACEFTDTDSLELMNKLKERLSDLNITVRQFKDGEMLPSDYFNRLEQFHREIEAESIDSW